MWYTPYQIKGGTHHSISLVVRTIPEHRVHKYIGRETDTHTMKQARTYKHTHAAYAKIHMRIAQHTPHDIDHVTLTLPSGGRS